MNLNKLLIVASKSRYELEIAKYGGEDKARKEYVQELWEDFRKGHYAQKSNLAKVKKRFGNDKVIDRAALTSEMINNYDTFVFLGGDNHFTYCSQLLLKYLQEHQNEEKAVIGTVLDPKRSWGGQLYFTVDSLLDNIPNLKKDRFTLEKWTTLDAKIKQGKNILQLHPAINEIYIGETKRWQMSRNYVYLNGQKIFPEKSSGILVVTGAGSNNGSWYDNVHNQVFNTSNIFGNEEEYARIFLTEHRSKSIATLEKGHVLTVHSSNDDAGIILPDCHGDKAIPFNMGAEAKIEIGSIKLSVISPL